jgi:hypothetical protein
LKFKFLLATASVEMGVTFKANLMFMEPGFSPLNFLQRYGRVARGEQQGTVWVSGDEDQKSWMRQLRRWLEQHQGQRQNIEALSSLLSKNCQHDFKQAEDDRHFGALPDHAYWTTGLYWQVMLQHPSTKGQKRQLFLQAQPSSSRMIFHLLQTVKTLSHDDMIGSLVVDWCKRFERQAFTLRDIGRRVRVVEENGLVRMPSELWLQRSTDITERFPPHESEDGASEFRIPGMLADYVLEKNRYIKKQVEVYFPHTEETALLENNKDLVKQWCRELKRSQLWDFHPEAMQAAEKLVRFTGMVVSDEPDISMAASSGIL